MENGVGCFGGIAYTCGCHSEPAFRNSGDSAGSVEGGGEDSKLPPLSNSAKEDPLDGVVFASAVPSVAGGAVVFSMTEAAISVIAHTR